MNTKFGQHLFKKFNNICNTKQLYQNYLEELNDYGIEKFTDELYMSNILTDTKISSDNNFFMKVVKKIIPYPNLLVTVGMDKYNDQYQIFDNLPCNNENYLSNDEQHLGKVSMSKFHKFICPKSDDPIFMNAIMFGSDKNKIVAIIEKLTEMRLICHEYAENLIFVI